jgi:hypothetical protein
MINLLADRLQVFHPDRLVMTLCRGDNRDSKWQTYHLPLAWMLLPLLHIPNKFTPLAIDICNILHHQPPRLHAVLH